MRSKPNSSRIVAASAIMPGSQPMSWAPRGRSCGALTSMRRVFVFSRVSDCADTISKKQKPSPFSRAMSRKGRSEQAARGDWMIREGRRSEPILSATR